MKRLFSLLFVALVAGSTFAAAAQGTLYTLATNGPSGNRLNIVILAEGYTANQSATFTNHARGIVSKFLSTAPYSAYTNYFNAYAIFVLGQVKLFVVEIYFGYIQFRLSSR